VEANGRLDVLVNNAGGAPPADSATVSPRFNEKILALNLTGPMTFSQAARRAMVEPSSPSGGGVILNISSVSGSRPNPQGVAYGAAKAGLENMGRTLAHEWGPEVRVVTVTVGLILTEESEQFYGDATGRAAVAGNLAMKRLGDPSEVADMCLVLASPLARWVTGTSVEVHGGGEGPAYLGLADRATDG
jgi:NAD(P)-dependent dehydrogenase (short-subunit alcohol dehydrogenase family)